MMENYQFIILIVTINIMFFVNIIHKNLVLKSIKSIDKEMKDYHKLMKGRNR